jgi:hypothetical protein
MAILGDRVAAVAIRDARANWVAPRLNGSGSACMSLHSINAHSLLPAHPGPPWHGRAQGFESPKLHNCGESSHRSYLSRVIVHIGSGHRPGCLFWLRQ